MVGVVICDLPGLERLHFMFDDELSVNNSRAKHVVLILQVAV